MFELKFLLEATKFDLKLPLMDLCQLLLFGTFFNYFNFLEEL